MECSMKIFKQCYNFTKALFSFRERRNISAINNLIISLVNKEAVFSPNKLSAWMHAA